MNNRYDGWQSVGGADSHHPFLCAPNLFQIQIDFTRQWQLSRPAGVLLLLEVVLGRFGSIHRMLS